MKKFNDFADYSGAITILNPGNEETAVPHVTPPELVILNLVPPDIDGQVVLRRLLREWLSAPIIILSVRDQEQQKIDALDCGADDYVAKPFGMDELLARMRAALRYTDQVGSESFTITIGDLRIDLASRLVFREIEELLLTPVEYKLFVTMLKHSGKVLAHRFLLEKVWGSHDTHETNYLRVFVASLRRKLEDDPARPRYLLTEQDVGYRFVAE